MGNQAAKPKVSPLHRRSERYAWHSVILKTSMLHGAKGGSPGMVAHSLNRGVPYDATDDDGMAVIHFASQYGKLDVLKLYFAMLSQHIADSADLNMMVYINMQNLKGEAGLHLAAMKGHIQVVTYLCQQPEIDLWLMDNMGNTALDVAVESKELEHEDTPAVLSEIMKAQLAGTPEAIAAAMVELGFESFEDGIPVLVVSFLLLGA